MATHPDVHPACENRFVNIDDALKDHDAKLESQNRLLIAQQEALKRHSRVLSRLEAQMGSAADSQHEASRQLATVTSMLEHLTDDVAEIKRMEWKLIGILVALVAALAGITKLADIGLL